MAARLLPNVGTVPITCRPGPNLNESLSSTLYLTYILRRSPLWDGIRVFEVRPLIEFSPRGGYIRNHRSRCCAVLRHFDSASTKYNMYPRIFFLCWAFCLSFGIAAPAPVRNTDDRAIEARGTTYPSVSGRLFNIAGKTQYFSGRLVTRINEMTC